MRRDNWNIIADIQQIQIYLTTNGPTHASVLCKQLDITRGAIRRRLETQHFEQLPDSR